VSEISEGAAGYRGISGRLAGAGRVTYANQGEVALAPLASRVNSHEDSKIAKQGGGAGVRGNDAQNCLIFHTMYSSVIKSGVEAQHNLEVTLGRASPYALRKEAPSLWQEHSQTCEGCWRRFPCSPQQSADPVTTPVFPWTVT